MNCPFSPIIDFTSLLGNVEGGLDKEDTGCDLAVSWLWMGRMPMWERDYGPIYMMPEISTYTKAQSLFLKDLLESIAINEKAMKCEMDGAVCSTPQANE